MKALLLSLVAASALTATVTPALAQSYWDRDSRDSRAYDYGRDDRGYDRGYDRRGGDMSPARIQELSLRTDEALRDGLISPTTANNLRRQIFLLRQSAWRFRNDGIVTGAERAAFERKYDYVSAAISNEAARGYGQDNRYARDDWRRR